MNNYLVDTPQFLDSSLKINTDGRNGRPAFHTAAFPEENLGQLGNAKRRMFYGPAAVDGQVEDSNYGHIVSAAAPRLIQIVAKFNF